MALFIFQDNKINGVTHNTRLLGSSYLFPYVIPDPNVTITTIQPEDQLIIIANQGLWNYISYQEAVNEIIDIPEPVLAAKKLQDLAQGYRSVENIGVLVVRLLTSAQEKHRMRDLLQTQFDTEQALLAELKLRDIEREEMRKRAELEEIDENVPMDVFKLKGAKRRKMLKNTVLGENGCDFSDEDDVVVKPFPRHVTDSKDPTENWETVLQKRLTEEVKHKELIYAVKHDRGHHDEIDSDMNWVTKSKGTRTVTLPPSHKNHAAPPPPSPPPSPRLPRRQIIPEAAQLSTESLEFQRELKHPLNVDRDAVLFHQMQLTRSKSHHISTDSIDSTQSDPAYRSIKEMSDAQKSSSHSIEVLLHGTPDYKLRTQGNIGGSHKLPTEFSDTRKRHSIGDSWPTEFPMVDRLKMLEEKGFLPKEKTDDTKSKARKSSSDQNMDKKVLHAKEEEEQTLVLDIAQESCTDSQDISKSVKPKVDQLDIRELHNKNVNILTGGSVIDDDDDDDSCSVTSTDSFSYVMHNDVYVEKPFENSDTESPYADIKDFEHENKSALSNMRHISNVTIDLLKLKAADSVTDMNSVNSSPEIMIMGPDSTNDPSELYATVKKVRKPQNEPTESKSDKINGNAEDMKKNGIVSEPKPDLLYLHKSNDSFDNENEDSSKKARPKPTLKPKPDLLYLHKRDDSFDGENKESSKPTMRSPTPIPVLPPKTDINSNSVKDLKELIAYNRLQQHQKVSYKHHPKAAPPPPGQQVNGQKSPVSPPTSMVTKTPSQRSIIITYL